MSVGIHSSRACSLGSGKEKHLFLDFPRPLHSLALDIHTRDFALFYKRLFPGDSYIKEIQSDRVSPHVRFLLADCWRELTFSFLSQEHPRPK